MKKILLFMFALLLSAFFGANNAWAEISYSGLNASDTQVSGTAATFKAAFAAIPHGGTVKLTSDHSTSNGTKDFVSLTGSYTWTLDFCGYGWTTNENQDNQFTIGTGATLKIYDTSAEADGGVNNTSNSGKHFCFEVDGGNLEINGGAYKSSSQTCINATKGSTVTINGGYFNSAIMLQGTNATINGGEFNAPVETDAVSATEQTSLTINGGTFNGDVSIDYDSKAYIYGGDFQSDESIKYDKTTHGEGEYNEVIIDRNKTTEGNTLTLVDKSSTRYESTYKEVIYRRPMTNTYGTVVVPFTPETVSEGTKFYTIDRPNTTKGELILTEVSSIEKGKPYIFSVTGSELSLSTTHTKADLKMEYTLDNSTNAPLYGTYGINVLENNEGKGVFAISKDKFMHSIGTGKVTVYPYRAWIQDASLESTGVKAFSLVVDDTVSGIATLDAQEGLHIEMGTIYNLQGKAVSTPVRGNMYIVNGKKILY